MAEHFSDWTAAVAAYHQRGEGFVLVTLLEVRGSAPRDRGTKMLVSIDQIIGTIGGGHLEHSVIQKARELLRQDGDNQHLEQYPLGAKLGQCCGGLVTVLFESFNRAVNSIAVFGAGHVGRALVDILAQLPVTVTWVDSRQEEFPNNIPAGVIQRLSEEPDQEVRSMPPSSFYVVLTHLHPLDYAITEQVLKRQDAAYLGVIGSRTKAQRFQMRLRHRGFTDEAIKQLHCPMGLASVTGKHPMEVAVSIAAEIINRYHQQQHQPTALTGIKYLAQIQQGEHHD